MVGKRISRLIKIVSGAVSDAEDEFFQIEGRLERFTHFCVLVCKSFNRNRCPIRAAALSYSSLLALIPLLAVAISVTSSLLKKEGEAKIYQAIDKFVSNVMPPATVSTNENHVSLNLNPGISVAMTQTNRAFLEAGTNRVAGTNLLAVAAASSHGGDERVVNAQMTAARRIHDFVQKTQSGTLGAIGMLALVLVAIRMLANIEATFNDIWGITRGRSWMWRIVLYWTTITLGPLALVGAVGLAGSSHLQTVKDFFEQMPLVGSLLFDFVPLAMLWLIFATVYLLVPNTRVKLSAALVGGIVAGSAWQLNNMLGFLYTSRFVTNSKIYGSLGLVPVFMIGLYFSWIILLFGAQVAYAFQNRKSYLQQKLVENINQRGREFVALRLMTCLGQRFQQGVRPATVHQLSGELGIPSPLTQSVLRTLAHKQLVTEVAGSEPAYVPARPLETINAYDILRAIRTGTGQELPLHEEPALNEIYGEFARIELAERNAAASISLQSLASRLTAPAALSGPAETTEADLELVVASEPEEESPAGAATENPPPPASIPGEKPRASSPETAPAIAQQPIRRNVVMPDENREFPL